MDSKSKATRSQTNRKGLGKLIILFQDSTCPEYVFEWIEGSHSVNIYWKKEYMQNEKLTVDYFSFDHELNKVSFERVKEHVQDKMKELHHDGFD